MALDLFLVDDLVPGEKEVARAVYNLRFKRSGGLFGMKAEHIWAWQRSEMQEGFTDLSNWVMVVILVQAAFCKVCLVEECAWHTAVLISKGVVISVVAVWWRYFGRR